ncbi:DUF418 domain-containing protein [Paenibacillus sp. NPDC058367]|uniref:DUF418 domain-containing protein n=1 Tax=Paenibacillus sp. NPDC058367 TaxID=3346460 RepID=UPI0036470F81
MNPSISQKERIVSLDIIRGLALFGILLINVGAFKVIIEGDPLPDYSGINGIINTLIIIFVQKKFFSIFSFLHVFIFWGTILPVYAIIGLFLIPFYHTTVSTLKKWLMGMTSIYIISLMVKIFLPSQGAISSILDIFSNDAMQIFIMFLAGFLTANSGWLTHIQELSKPIRWIQIASFLLVGGISLWIWNASQSGSSNVDSVTGLGSLPTTLFYLTTLFLLLENKQMVKFLTPISRVGQMAFTNYVAQSIIGTAIISMIGLEVVSPKDILYIAVLIYIIQIICSTILFKFFSMGPLEKLWRLMTYGTKPATKNPS